MKKLKYGNTNTYFINGLLLDTDVPGTLPLLFRELKKNGIDFREIRYVLPSHYHPDHIGLVSELMDRGVRLILPQHQASQVHFADELLRRQYGKRCHPIDETQAIRISVEGGRAFLHSIGISGELLATSSHSRDGVALALDDGHCFVGDLEPWEYIEAYEDNSPLQRDWEAIWKLHPKVIHFGHANDRTLPQAGENT